MFSPSVLLKVLSMPCYIGISNKISYKKLSLNVLDFNGNIFCSSIIKSSAHLSSLCDGRVSSRRTTYKQWLNLIVANAVKVHFWMDMFLLPELLRHNVHIHNVLQKFGYVPIVEKIYIKNLNNVLQEGGVQKH